VICRVISWLHEWQELVGAIIGASALAFTVWWTLSSERRKRHDEATAFRVALGVELRQFASRALGRHEAVLGLLPRPIVKDGYIDSNVSALIELVRFPDPVIYAHAAGNVGVLGESAHFIVLFYNDLWNVTDTVRELATAYAPRAPNLFPTNQVIYVAALLLVATENAVKALPAFAGMVGSENDEQFKQAVTKAREEYESLTK